MAERGRLLHPWSISQPGPVLLTHRQQRINRNAPRNRPHLSTGAISSAFQPQADLKTSQPKTQLADRLNRFSAGVGATGPLSKTPGLFPSQRQNPAWACFSIILSKTNASEGKLMRATITVLLIILPVLILGCTLNQRSSYREIWKPPWQPGWMAPRKLGWRPRQPRWIAPGKLGWRPKKK